MYVLQFKFFFGLEMFKPVFLFFFVLDCGNEFEAK